MEEDKKPSSIKSFLSRFKTLVPPNKKIKELFILELNNRYNIELEPNQVRVMKNHIYIRTTPIRKTVILQNKELIISLLKEELNLTYLEIS